MPEWVQQLFGERCLIRYRLINVQWSAESEFRQGYIWEVWDIGDLTRVPSLIHRSDPIYPEMDEAKKDALEFTGEKSSG